MASAPSRKTGSNVPGEQIVSVLLSKHAARCLRCYHLGTKKSKSSNNTGTVADTVPSLMNDRATESKKTVTSDNSTLLKELKKLLGGTMKGKLNCEVVV